MGDIDSRLERKIDQLFEAADRDEALRILRGESGIRIAPLMERHERDMTRIRAALLKISNGSLERLRKYVKYDWRDLLVWSGFGAGTAWEDWLNDSSST